VKKEGKGDKKGLIQYSSGIETIGPYLQLAQWNEQAIEQRAEDLFNKAKEIWKA
jgi:hypothetical protein